MLSKNLVKVLGAVGVASAAVGQSGALPPNASAAANALPAFIALLLSVLGYAHK